ncbi:hypothetical protein SVIOM74S_05836 [Streptomyces violarus]
MEPAGAPRPRRSHRRCSRRAARSRGHGGISPSSKSACRPAQDMGSLFSGDRHLLKGCLHEPSSPRRAAARPHPRGRVRLAPALRRPGRHGVPRRQGRRAVGLRGAHRPPAPARRRARFLPVEHARRVRARHRLHGRPALAGRLGAGRARSRSAGGWAGSTGARAMLPRPPGRRWSGRGRPASRAWWRWWTPATSARSRWRGGWGCVSWRRSRRRSRSGRGTATGWTWTLRSTRYRKTSVASGRHPGAVTLAPYRWG